MFAQLGVSYHATKRPRPDQSPFESIACGGYASCTGLSIILVDACRAVNIPARLALVPLWKDNSGNHTWVEFFDPEDSQWHYLGASEPSAVDSTWFSGKASQAQPGTEYGVYAVSFQRTSMLAPLVWLKENDYVFATDVSGKYIGDHSEHEEKPEGWWVAPEARPVHAQQPAEPPKLTHICIDPQGGLCREVQVGVAIQGARVEAFDVYVTTDSSEPSEDSRKLQQGERIVLPESCCVKALAVHPEHPPGMCSAWFTLGAQDPALAACLNEVPLDPWAEEHVALATWDAVLTENVVPPNVAAARRCVWEKYKKTVFGLAPRIEEVWSSNAVCSANKEVSMRFSSEVIGEMPEGGFPMFICMHGGGGCPAAVNDEQWMQMQAYYKASVACGVYVAPRGVRDTWHTHFNPESYGCYDRLIENAVAFHSVNPNKVYLLGYSAGGDGVYQIAPRMADRFAAACMCAGHHNGCGVTNLHHLPLLMQVGAQDTAYDRHAVTVDQWQRIQAARTTHSDGYITECFVHAGRGHNFQDHDPSGDVQAVMRDPVAWKAAQGDQRDVVLRDTNAVHWVSQHVRDPAPKHLVWEVGLSASRERPAGAVHEGCCALNKLHYWLDISQHEGGYDAPVVEVCVTDNTVDVLSVGSQLRLLLDGRLVDMDRPVKLRLPGFQEAPATEVEVRVQPCLSTIARTMLERGDPSLVFECAVSARVEGGVWEVGVTP